MPRTILLTGASGFIGTNLLKAASRAGSEDLWICADRIQSSPCQAGCHRPVRCEFRPVDLCDASAVEALLGSVSPDAVLHFAGATSKATDAENRSKLLALNLATTWNLAGSLPRPAYFMIPSTGMVYGDREEPFTESMEPDPVNEYSLSKLLAERTLRTYARLGRLRPCILRPSVLYGDRQKGDMFIPAICHALREGKRFPMTEGAQTRDFLHIDDFCQAVLLLLGGEAEGTFNVGYGQSVSLLEAARTASRLAGTGELGVGEVPYRENEIWKYGMDIGRLRKATGWSPHITLAEGMKRIIDRKEKP